MAAAKDQKAIFVCVRTRPLSLTERVNENSQCIFQTTNDRVIKIVGEDSKGAQKDNDYTLDHCFGEDDSNEDVYNTIGRQTLDNAFEGYNGTIFAYGQTGSGKTHTMMGGEGAQEGIIPRLCKDIFARIAETGSQSEVFVSYVEIYGQSEKLADLLAPDGKDSATKLAMRQKGPEEYYVQGLTTYQPTSAVQMEMFIRSGSEKRAVASTQMNDTSSRSHAVFIVELAQTIGGVRKTGRIKLVDLAGSENINKSGAQGQRQVEAVSINKALSTLRRVLDACADTKGRKHIPFRDSALTKLLADSIGGNCRTTMIAAVGPSAYNYSESKNTLQWACKARKIKCKAVKNENNEQAKVQSLKSEVEELREKLRLLELNGKKGGADPKELALLQDQLAGKEAELRAELEAAKEREVELQRVQAETRERLDHLKKDYDESQHNLGNARLAWRALVRNLKFEEGRNEEMTAELGQLQQKLERYAVIDDVEAREAVLAAKEVTLGNLEEHEAAVSALRGELEPRLEWARAKEAELEAREAAVAEREQKVVEREAFLLKRDEFYGRGAPPGNPAAEQPALRGALQRGAVQAGGRALQKAGHPSPSGSGGGFSSSGGRGNGLGMGIAAVGFGGRSSGRGGSASSASSSGCDAFLPQHPSGALIQTHSPSQPPSDYRTRGNSAAEVKTARRSSGSGGDAPQRRASSFKAPSGFKRSSGLSRPVMGGGLSRR
jgi:hypothetical protein